MAIWAAQANPEYFQKQPWCLPEETREQFMCGSTYVLRHMVQKHGQYQTNTKQNSGRTDPNRKKYAKYHIKW